MDELAIKIEHVSKQYRLGAIGGGTLTADLQSWWARKRGREDPNSKIGARTDIKIGEKFLALDDINLEVKKGEALGIIGHNGAGKSTLLKLLSRVTAPTTGSISYNGRITSMLEVGTGFHGELTGRENIYMNGAILGMTKKEIESKMEQIIDFSEVRQFIDTPVKRYSSGMYVKLAFSVAAHLDSEIMIMDEVLAVGDMAFQKKCLDKMREVATKEGRTVLYVSHNMNTIRRLCDRCILMEKGKILFNGDVEEAIGIYMQSSKLSGGSVDLSVYERSSMFSDPTVKMQRLDVNTESGVFTTGSLLAATLSVSSEKDIEEVLLEIPVRSTVGTSVTRFTSSPTISLHTGEQNQIRFVLDISHFAPGHYSLNPVLRTNTDWNTQLHLDGIVDAFIFQIVPSPGFNRNIEWNTYYSGYYVAPEIQLCE